MRIASAMQQATSPFVSLEFFPPSDPETLPEFYTVVDALKVLNPLFVSVTYGAGGRRQSNTLAVTSELVRRNLVTMAHLTCVGATKERIASFLQDLRKVGVENVLALRGDPPVGAPWNPDDGPFRHAQDLVQYIRSVEPDMGVAVAAYPTPHPESASFEEDRARTAEKMNMGADFAITQLFFDVREYLALVKDLRSRGITKPIIPGILTVQSFASLKRILSLSGASIPGKLYLRMEEANEKGGAEAVREAGLVFASREIRRLIDSGAAGVHLYTLNRAELCLEIMDRVGRLA